MVTTVVFSNSYYFLSWWKRTNKEGLSTPLVYSNKISNKIRGSNPFSHYPPNNWVYIYFNSGSATLNVDLEAINLVGFVIYYSISTTDKEKS